MPESAPDLLDRIRLSEDESLELKEVVLAGKKLRGSARDALADEMAAFANTRGGTLVLGISDRTREVTGIPLQHLDVVERYVAEIVEDSVDPPLDASIHRTELAGAGGAPRPVLRIVVPRSLFVHRSPSGFLRRVGSSKRVMKTEELARLLQNRSQSRLIRFDEQWIARASAEDLEAALVDRLQTKRTSGDLPTLARKLGMVTLTDDETMRPTVAGILLGSSHPERWLPNAFIQAVRYRGREITESWDLTHYQLDAEDIYGPLDTQITKACDFVFRNQTIAASKYMGRMDIPQYDMASVFEALVNAVAHRDYSLHGSHIRLRMFSDRLEIYSPGGLVNSMELGLLADRQATRNETVVNLLRLVPVPREEPGIETARQTFMDKRGEGVPIILERSEAHSGRTPEYRMLGESELLLTIFAAGPDESGYAGGNPEERHGMA